MKSAVCTAPFLALFGVALMANSAAAFFHLWDFSEVFSTADGDVQFIELHTTGLSEVFATGIQIRSVSTGNIFTFDHNLSGSTANRDLLIATAGFGSLPGGVAADFTLPVIDFFNPAGDTIRLCQSTCTGLNIFDSRTFASVPTDGVTSLQFLPTVTTGINSPANFSGASGSVDLAPEPTGDYNGNLVVDAADYTVWRDTFGQAAVPQGNGADGDGDGTIGLGDYDFWKSKFGNVIPPGSGSVVAVPEPASGVVVAVGLLTVALRRWSSPR